MRARTSVVVICMVDDLDVILSPCDYLLGVHNSVTS